MTCAMILAAGLGTRLRPLTDELPKPLIWLGDKPVLAHIAERLTVGKIEAMVVNTHHLPEAFERFTLDGPPMTLVHEPEILGTAGGVANAAKALGSGEVLVWNGDILVDLDVEALIHAHRLGSLPATLAVAPRPMGQGTVGLDASGDVVRLRDEHFGVEVSGGDFVGVHVLGEAVRAALPGKGCLVEDVYLPHLREGRRLGTFEVAGAWSDIGTLSAYFDATARWLARAHPGAPSYVADSARVDEGVDVTGSVIGFDAVIEGHGALRDCIVWPGARAQAPLEGACVTTSGRIAWR